MSDEHSDIQEGYSYNEPQNPQAQQVRLPANLLASPGYRVFKA